MGLTDADNINFEDEFVIQTAWKPVRPETEYDAHGVPIVDEELVRGRGGSPQIEQDCISSSNDEGEYGSEGHDR